MNGDFALAVTTLSSILETIITRRNRAPRDGGARPHHPRPGTIVDWSFSDRIAVAERAGVISRGCARLPEVARLSRDQPTVEGDLIPAASVSARDAKLTSDVLPHRSPRPRAGALDGFQMWGGSPGAFALRLR